MIPTTLGIAQPPVSKTLLGVTGHHVNCLQIAKTPTGFQWILDLLQSISLYLVKCGLSKQKDCFRAVLLAEASSNRFKKLANGSKQLQSASLILVLE